jgi:hypothetical protein
MNAPTPPPSPPFLPPKALTNAWSARSCLYPKEISTYLGCSTQQVINFIESGDLLAYDIGTGGRHWWRVPVEPFVRWLSRRASPVSPPR